MDGWLRRVVALATLQLVAWAGAAPWLADADRQLEAARREASAGRTAVAAAYLQTIAPGELRVAWIGESGTADRLLQQTVHDAVDRWNRYLAGTVRLSWTDDPATAHILVSFVDRLEAGGRFLAGHSSWMRTVRQSTSAPQGTIRVEIRLARRGPRGRDLRPDERLHAALHELGHALGLADSADPTSVMSPLGLGPSPSVPSEDDARSVWSLHSAARRVLAP